MKLVVINWKNKKGIVIYIAILFSICITSCNGQDTLKKEGEPITDRRRSGTKYFRRSQQKHLVWH